MCCIISVAIYNIFLIINTIKKDIEIMSNETLVSLLRELLETKSKITIKLIEHLVPHELQDKLHEMSIGQFAWHVVNDTWEKQKCFCGNDLAWRPHKRNYSVTCSKECGFKNPQRREKTHSNCIEKIRS